MTRRAAVGAAISMCFGAVLLVSAIACSGGRGVTDNQGVDAGSADAHEVPDAGHCAGPCADGGDVGSPADGGQDTGDGGAVFVWPACDRLSGGESLAAKASYFDETARTVHIAGDGLLRNVLLTEDLQGVEIYYHVENTILWSGMYLASQAFRYAVTGSGESLQNARTVVAAMRELTAVTGVTGLYGRSMLKPGVPYNEISPDDPGWTDSPVPGLDGWRYRNDVSKDGYAGMMFGYSAALEHFDDEALLADVRELAGDAVRYIVGNNLQIIDADGVVTEHGRLYQSALDDYPGFNALLASSWVRIGADATGDASLDDFYYVCLMRMRKGMSCPPIDTLDMGPYIESMETMLNLFLPNCRQNYDNFDMCYQAIYPLLRRERDDVLKERLLGVLRNNMFHTDDPRFQSIATIGNSLFTFDYAALTGEGPEDNPVLAQAVDDAICRLKEFPPRKFQRHIPAGAQAEACRNRLDEPTSATMIPLAEYDFDNYLWRLDFFKIQSEVQEDRRNVWSPEDFLVAYWLGRYHHIIPADL